MATLIAAQIVLAAPIHAQASRSGKPTRICRLTTRYYSVGGPMMGDAKSFSVMFKLVGTAAPNEGVPWTVQAHVIDHNRRLSICRLNFSVTITDPTSPTGGGELTKKAHIGPHGGVSSPVTFPPNAWGGPEAEIYTWHMK